MLRTELADVTATTEVCGFYIDLWNKHPEARDTLSSLRNVIHSQITGGLNQVPVRLADAADRPNQGSVLPSVFAPPGEILNLPEKMRVGHEARKAAYLDLIRASSPITEFSLHSACLLHEMGAIQDAETLDLLLKNFRGAIASGSPRIITHFQIDSRAGIRLEAVQVMVRLAVKLDRMDEIAELTEVEPEGNHWAATQARRLTILAAIYSADNADRFVEICAENFVTREISLADIETAREFSGHPISTITKVFLATLATERPNLVNAGDIIALLVESPLSDEELLIGLVRKFMASEGVPPIQKHSLAGAIIQKKNLLFQYDELVPDLVGHLLSASEVANNNVPVQFLQPVADLISLRLAEDAEAQKWRDAGKRLITILSETPDGLKIDEAFADTLLGIALTIGEDDLLEKIVEKIAANFTWPFERVYLLLRKGKIPAAAAMLEHGTQDSIFPLYLTGKAPPELMAETEAAMERTPDQRNTFIAMLLAKSVLRNKPDDAQLIRAREVLQTVTTRWGAIEHPDEGFLQQGNRVLWREESVDLEAAVPALRLWEGKNPIKAIFSPDGAEVRMTDAKEEVWQRCLNSGHFGKEVAWISELMSAAGLRGDAEAHRKITERLVDIISFGNTRTSVPKPLSPAYPYVKTWLVIHLDPSVPLELPVWQGMLSELRGLGLSDEDSASMVEGVLSKCKDSNYNRGLSAVRCTLLYARIGEVEDPALDIRLLGHRWSPNIWWPVMQGDPETVFEEIDSTLGGLQNRETWASLLFSKASNGPFTPQNTHMTLEEKSESFITWAEGFHKRASGSWLEIYADSYLSHVKNREHQGSGLIDFDSPGILRDFDRLPLGLRHQLATGDNLDAWFKANPDRLETTLPACVETICEAITRAPQVAEGYWLRRCYSVGRLPEIMLPDYAKNADRYRPLYTALRKAADIANARFENDSSPETEAMLKPLRSFLLRIETLDDQIGIPAGSGLNPTQQLLVFIESGEVARVVAILKDTSKEFRFDVLPNGNRGSMQASGLSVDRKVISEILDAIPAEMTDQRMYFRILTRPYCPRNTHLLRNGPGEISADVLRESASLVSDFDNFEFSDKEMEKACLDALASTYAAGRNLPRKLRASKKPTSKETAGTRAAFPPYLNAWCDLVIHEGDEQEFDKILTLLLEEKESRARENDHRFDLDWSVIRWALEDGLGSGDRQRESGSLAMVNRFRERTADSGNPTIEVNRKLLSGVLIGYHLARSSDKETIRSLREEISGFKHAPRSWYRNNHSIIDQAIGIAGKLALAEPDARKGEILAGLQSLQLECPPTFRSISFLFHSFEAGLVPLVSAIEKCQSFRADNPEDPRVVLDLASLYIAAKDSEKAGALLDQLTNMDVATDLSLHRGTATVRRKLESLIESEAAKPNPER